LFVIFSVEQVHELMAQSNLIIEILVAVALIFSIFFLVKYKKYIWHGNAQLVTVIVVVLMLVMHMAPAYIYVIIEEASQPDISTSIGFFHGLIGIAALIPSIWLVSDWAYAKASDLSFCAPKKRMMIAIITCWAAALGFGIVYYFTHLFFG
jgi:hypothetical protein